MIVERVAAGLLILMSIFMLWNVVAASDRLGDATESFDKLESELVNLTYSGPEEPVEITIQIDNPTGRPVEIATIEFATVFNGRTVGGGEERPDSVIEGHSSEQFELVGRINDVRSIEDTDPDDPIDWQVLGRFLVEVDEDLDREWKLFGFRTTTP